MTSSKRKRGAARRMLGWRGRVGLDDAGGAIDRPGVVRLLKSGCTLAQGFCIVLCILSLLGLVASVAELGRVVTEPRPAASEGQAAGEASLVERLYLGGEDPLDDAQTADDGRWGDLVNGSASAARGAYSTDAAGQAGIAGRTDSTWVESDALITNESAPIGRIVRNTSMALLLAVIFWVGARFFRRISVSGEPFRPERARELSHVADLLLVLAIVPGLLEAGTLWLGVVLLPGVSYDITYGFLNYGLLAGAILMLAFVRVFSYGCLLQQQDDELV